MRSLHQFILLLLFFLPSSHNISGIDLLPLVLELKKLPYKKFRVSVSTLDHHYKSFLGSLPSFAKILSDHKLLPV
jgi:hypothetical protein